MQSSPSFGTIQPRKLTFGSPPFQTFKKVSLRRSEVPETSKPVQQSSLSPPYRKVRALRLFDTPATPKTIIQKSSVKSFNHLTNVEGHCLTDKKPCNISQEGSSCPLEKPKPVPLHNRILDNSFQSANVNPFTPNSLLAQNKKRCRTQFGRENNNQKNTSLISFLNSDFASIDLLDDNAADFLQAPKRLALQDTNISRYKKEFLEISLIGVGEFGLVYQCLNRLDGCIYAIKKSIKPVAGSSFEKRALNEVWAHAVLGKHDNVVRYYSAWAEDNHMLIQNEFCNGGSLQSFLQKRTLSEPELKILLLHVSEGLKYIHSNDLVHMDLKAGNIFLTKVTSKCLPLISDNSYEEDIDGIYDELDSAECIITYKIGDLGHVTSVKEAHVEEGDCRYLPNEILQEDFSQLVKADIFSLGITLYEAAGGGPLPKNGPEWHKLRNGNIPDLPSLSRDFNDLIKLMTHPDPEKRPSSSTIFNHPILCSLEFKSKSQLTQELAIERRKNEILMKKLKEARKLLNKYEQAERTKYEDIKSSPTSGRCLRSYVRKKRKSCTEEHRDRNKMIINNMHD